MKVLFGLNNDDTVKGIVELYEKKYNEKLEYKNVYYRPWIFLYKY